MYDFQSIFQTYVDSDDVLILAVSGGVDSMVLLHMVERSHPRAHIVIAHYNHSLRWEESDGDEALVRATATRLGIRYEVGQWDISVMAKAEKMSIEMIARRERYTFFEEVRMRYGGRYILIAHHASDQAETILMHLIKWGKSRWLSGMPTLSGYIYRPLLSLSKRDILEYAEMHSISYREDSSNMSDIYERNRIRHDILPRMREMNPTIEETLTELGEYATELTLHLSLEVDRWLQKESENQDGILSFSVSAFLGESVFFQKEIITTLYSRAHDGSTQWLSRGLIAELIRYITTAEGATIKPAWKLRLEKKKNQVYY